MFILKQIEMKIKSKFLQEGGQAPVAPAQGQPSPEEQLMGMAQQLIQQLGPEAAAMLAQVIVQMLQGGQQSPAYARKGGKLVKVIGK